MLSDYLVYVGPTNRGPSGIPVTNLSQREEEENYNLSDPKEREMS